RRRFDRFDGIDVEELPEDRVEREEGRGHPGATGQECATAHREPSCVDSRRLMKERGDALLLWCGRQGEVFLVRDDLQRERRERVRCEVPAPLPDEARWLQACPPERSGGCGLGRARRLYWRRACPGQFVLSMGIGRAPANG